MPAAELPGPTEAELVLLVSVPSLTPEWARWCEDRVAYLARFPDAELTDEDRRYEFLWILTAHVAARLHEAHALFAALEQVYLGADEALAGKLTVAFLENLIMAADDIPGALPVLDETAASAGPRVRQEYKRARDYLRGPPGSPDDPCWVRP